MDKQNVISAYNEILYRKEILLYYFINYFIISKRKEILIQATTWMNLEDSNLNKVSQSQKDNYCMILLICNIFCCSVAKPDWFFCDPMHCSSLGSFVHEIFQVRILEWVATYFPRDAVSTVVIFIELESRMVVIRNRGGGNGELVFNSCRVLVWEAEKVLEMDGGDGCKIWMYLMAQKCRLRIVKMGNVSNIYFTTIKIKKWRSWLR